MMFDLIASKNIRRVAAKLTPRWLRSPLYKMLYRKLKVDFTLSKEDFNGKRVLIVGSAITALSEIIEFDADSYDVICKMNNGIFIPIPTLRNESRCDILFHSLTSDTKMLSLSQIQTSGVRTIVHRLPKRSVFLRTVIEEERFEGVASIKIIPHEDYQSLSEELDGYSPSTGLVCVNFFLNTNASEVKIIGFTFFTTRYISGYDDSVGSDKESLSRVELAGHHSPKHEARLMQNIIEQAQHRGINVTVGSSMRDAIHKIRKQV